MANPPLDLDAMETIKHEVEHEGHSLTGTKLGEFQVLEQLGEGGMGIVYRGQHPLLGKQVAIKVLRPEIADDPRQVQRLLDEARAVNAVRHPGLVDIFSFGRTPSGAQYIVMELLHGQSLDALLRSGGKLSVWETLPILQGALTALDAAHSAGVIHRDLKPSNIFLVELRDHTRLVKLLDFGLAKIAPTPRGSAAQTSLTTVVGTAEYMSPEQAKALEVSPASDLYSMGVVAYQALTGSPPFSDPSAVKVIQMQVHAEPQPPAELEPSIPVELDRLVLKLLSKSPADRPATAADVNRELHRIELQMSRARTRIV